MTDAFIAVDWGTTNRRAYRIEGGIVAASERGGPGAAATPAEAYPAEVAGLRDRLGDLPMLLGGMVGSTIGWRSVAYASAPAGLGDLVAAVEWIDDRTGIVPGVSIVQGMQGDVMRGEELQILGAVAAGMVPGDALVCQPGTHCKWATVAAGRIASFTTAMTGELFGLLRTHSVLKGQLMGDVTPGDAFVEGVREGAKRDLAASLFGVRAASVLGLRDNADVPSYASGLLIGADVAARIEAGMTVYLLADANLGALYAAAISTLGGQSVAIDSEAAFLAGVTHLWELAR
ncbi:2-dehydro-3-deoxygalactonokinase [Sphingomonas qomolangmaensis]|uniref:2-dehydro-3-deoxygalactonokinase n=1 Tax=Sphingomonas qomolangmaensis TaxID=2918765 RepID=A0ABY5LB55_9SPHN|nr:2-dehydro-3-deoxygalactonokinase [Sphingomonas qomolangmaensis]UUL83102.1 2-dehydro-3-deoxygalactonokinase [Sphingomonas qomolangmaensis]